MASNLNDAWRAESLRLMGKKKKEIIDTIQLVFKQMPKRRVKEFRRVMDLTGAGNNIAVIKLFYELGRKIKNADRRTAKGT